MGFWNGKVDGPLDKMFDFDRDGKLNAWERAMELGLLMDDEDGLLPSLPTKTSS